MTLPQRLRARAVGVLAPGEPSPRYPRERFGETPVPFETLLVGTHHKTGSVWMRGVFEHFARETHARFVHAAHGALSEGDRRTVAFDGHSRFEGIARAGARGIHIVRDPRDVVVSSVHYHRRAAEPWLHEPRFRGKTYQETINGLGDTDAMLFEIDNSAGRNIAAMAAFEDGETFRTLKYEDLLSDIALVRWSDALRWLGLAGLDLVLGLEAVHENSRFGGKTTAHMRKGGTTWQREMPDTVRARLEERFPTVLDRLGYG